MKNIANINCILVGIIIAAIFAITVPTHIKVNKAEKALDYVDEEIDEYRGEDGEIDDIGGVGLVVSQLAYGLGVFGILAAKLILWLFDAYAIVLLICNVVARLIYGNTKGRILGYRIIIGLVCVLLGVLAVPLLWLSVESLSAVGIIAAILLILVIVCLIRNTYTKKVYEVDWL